VYQLYICTVRLDDHKHKTQINSLDHVRDYGDKREGKCCPGQVQPVPSGDGNANGYLGGGAWLFEQDAVDGLRFVDDHCPYASTNQKQQSPNSRATGRYKECSTIPYYTSEEGQTYCGQWGSG